MIAVVIFGIFLALSYFMFQDQMKNVLATVVDGVNHGTLVSMDKTLGKQTDEVLVTNPESDFTFNGTGTITGYTGTRSDLVIPATINGVVVKELGLNAFKAKGLTSVYIPNGVRTINNSAFSGNSLTNITLPDTVTYIGYYAFMNNKLTSVTIPNGVTYIAQQAFYNNLLTSVTIPYSVTTIEEFAFYNNPLQSASLPTDFTNFKAAPASFPSFPTMTVITRY